MRIQWQPHENHTMKHKLLRRLRVSAVVTAAICSAAVSAQESDPALRAKLLAARSSVVQAQVLAQAPVTTGGPATEPSTPSQRLTLEQAHAIALKNHPGVLAADFRASAAGELYIEARSGLLPQVSLFGTVARADAANTRIMAGGLNNPTVYSRSAFGAGASQLITDFGRTSNFAASAKLQASAENQNAQATREQVLLEVDRSFFAVLQAQALQNVAQQTVDTRQLLLDRVSILAANKLKSDLDVSFARVALEQSKLLLESAHNDFDSALASLSAVLGFDRQQRFEVVEVQPTPAAAASDLDPLIDEALRNRPELASLRDQRDAALRLARSLRDARFPTISAVIATGDAPSHDVRLPDNYAAGGLQLSVPLFAGGFYQARQHEAEYRARVAGEALRGFEDNVARDVRIAWLNLNNSREKLRTSQQLSRYAADAYQLAEARYKAGSSSIVELSQAQLELTSAQIGEAGARYDVLITESALNFAIGRLRGGAGERAPGE
jgi:outer membrane protein